MSTAHPGGATAGRAATWVRPHARREALRRRVVTVPLLFAAFTVYTVALPVLIVGAMLVDLVRAVSAGRPWVAVRLVVMGWAYLLAEVVGLAALAGIWLTGGAPGAARRRRLMTRTFAVQRLWTAFLLWAGTAVFRLRWSVSGSEQAAPGPVLVLMRHASIVDTLLPSALVTARHGIRLRYVLKRELLVDPCLDVAGNRLPNCFVDRSSVRSDEEIARVRALGADLGTHDGVLIYPEGTRFTAAKQQRAIARVHDSDPQRGARVAHLRHVLPPHLGGTLALLEAAPEADVVICAHHGLDGLARVADVWGGALVGRRIEVGFWRIPRAQVPLSGPARAEWLDETWSAVDAWIAATDGP